MSDKKQVGFRLPTEQHEKFENEANKIGMTISALMQMFIAEWLRKRGVK